MSSAQQQQQQIQQQGGNYVSRDQRKHEKDLEKARQLGQIPAEKDEEGKDINPHMPKFITNAPWYLDKHRPSLQHQKWFEQKEKSGMNEWYARGQRGHQATKFRKGACENCGAMTHKAKDCCERPRKKGAKLTGQDIKADEIIVDLDLDYAAKRDRYNGYNPEMYQNVIEEHEVFEEERKKKKDELNQEDQEDYDYKQSNLEEQQVTHGAVDNKTKTSSMNLRIREDRAVYLENLDVDSAFFDPKSRAMRDNPTPHLPEDQQRYKGLNYIRNTGETAKILEQEVFAWEKVQNKGAELSSIAMPSATEKFFSKQKQENIDKKNEKMKKFLDQYGGGEHFKTKDDLANLYKEKGQTAIQEEQELEKLEKEKEMELNLKMKNVQATGGNSKVMKLSKYPEDQYQYGHTSIWGSWWNETLGWGYDCCHGTDKMTYCEGPKAKKLATIREYHAKKAAEQKLKEFEAQKEQEELNEEQQEQESVEQQQQLKSQQQEENFKAPLSKKNTNTTTQEKKAEEEQSNSKETNDDDKASISSKSSSGSDSSSDSDSSSSSDSDSDSGSSSDSDSSSSSSSSESESESESDKKKKKKSSKQSKKKQVEKKKKLSKKQLKQKEKEKKKKKDNFEKLDPKKVEEAVKREKLRKQQMEIETDDRKRKYNSQRKDIQYEATEEEIEAYKLTKVHFDDPMAKFNDVD